MLETVRPGIVDWTGDNPFLYLKEDPAGDWSSLSLFFRITASDHGVGHLALVVEDPYGAADSGAVRVGLTDNVPLARFLLEEFVAKFVLFRPCTHLPALELIDGAVFETARGASDWVETARAGDRSIELSWTGLGTPFAVDVQAPDSGTGAHEMFSVFRIASSAAVTVDGRRLPGATVERDFLNGPSQSAAMALSETWVRE